MDDYISRETAKEVIGFVRLHNIEYGENKSLLDAINEIPSADVAPVVHGRWEVEIEDGMYWYVCSECGNEVPKSRYRTDYFSDYCPNCGARMDDIESTYLEMKD